MKIGTRSVLFGAHQFLIHPMLLFVGWWQEYGFGPVEIGYKTVWISTTLHDAAELRRAIQVQVLASLWNPRLWVAFFVHDLGYIGKPNMDGAEGETHPQFGARIMGRLFGEPWGDFVLLHSRYYSKRLNRPVSPLCYADKRVIVLEPLWLYLPRVWATGELDEFMAVAQRRAAVAPGPNDPLTTDEREAMASGSPVRWSLAVRSYMRRWIAEHKGGKPDMWTRTRTAL